LSGPKTNNACTLCAVCCSMLCNCAEGLHFSAFHIRVAPILSR